MFEEDELLPLSALQHVVFCERQCALIYVEGVWRDNPRTLEGSHLHARVHGRRERRELRGDTLVVRGLPIRSLRLGLVGRADVVEFIRMSDAPNATPRQDGVVLEGLEGRWTPFPVEYKRGRPKTGLCDEVQLCAQAVCIEEMLDTPVSRGALFYGAVRRRHDVAFTDELRREMEAAAARLREVVGGAVTPAAQPGPKCKLCSLAEICRPDLTDKRYDASHYIVRECRDVIKDEEVSREASP